eukprot:703054-Rhodomonas_salina.1
MESENAVLRKAESTVMKMRTKMRYEKSALHNDTPSESPQIRSSHRISAQAEQDHSGLEV